MLRTLIIEQGPNPSTDFFVAPWLRDQGDECVRLTFNELPSPAALDGARLVLVRYVPPRWRALIEQQRHRLADLVFFMDDDLFDRRAFAAMPWHYQWKLWSLACRHQGWLKRMGARLWVSSPYLADKYAAWQPQTVPFANPHQAGALQTLFYHGSASHRAEFEWLLPVVEQALARCPQLAFEVIGDRRTRAQFARIPRVQVLYPMAWPAYQALLQRPGRTIGLAPLLDVPFNAARSPTKFFDITQAGAVGLYAQGPIYQPVVEHGVNGLLLPMNRPEAWVDAIEQLVADEPRRLRMLAEAKKSVAR